MAGVYKTRADLCHSGRAALVFMGKRQSINQVSTKPPPMMLDQSDNLIKNSGINILPEN